MWRCLEIGILIISQGEKNMLKRHIFKISFIALACSTSVYAASPVNLSHQPASVLQSFMPTPTAANHMQTMVKETSSQIDLNQTKHMRVQQTYAGYRVWGADAVVHVPQGAHASLLHLNAGTTMNGVMYKDLDKDLQNTPHFIMSAEQADRAFKQATQLYQKKTGVSQYDEKTAKKELIVYIDKNNKAHWAYFITFQANPNKGIPEIPTYILDAVTFDIYADWNNLQTEEVDAGGFGGNVKMQKVTYDGMKSDLHFPILNIKRDGLTHKCTLENNIVTVKDNNHKDGWLGAASVASFQCDAKDNQHGNLYWDGDQDAVNGAFSPANDAFYIGQVINDMYHAWYKMPALMLYGIPGTQAMLELHVHVTDVSGQPMENAFFHPLLGQMFFGDGGQRLYPLTSLGVGAHEISHGFTSQHSNLTYEKQSGGLNESFSDMAAQAAEYYSIGHNNWQIGPEIFKGDRPLRYMDDPTKDGKSIDNVKDYDDELNVHYTSGVFNKAFYLLATSPGWNTHKAFDVMVDANMHQWTANSTFEEAACGVLRSAAGLHYDTAAVKSAMQGVGIDVGHC